MRTRSLVAVISVANVLGQIGPAAAQAPPAVQGANVQATAINENGDVRFSYAIVMAPNGTGAVTFFTLDVSSACLVVPQVAAGVAVAAPEGWQSVVTPRVDIGWAANPGNTVQPGGTTQGFAVTANALVGVCPFQLKPDVDPTALGLDAPELESDVPTYLARVEAIVSSLSVRGTTIGPVQPPAVFDAVSFLGSLVASKESAYSMGWIQNAGIKKSLDAKLDAAGEALTGGDTTTAANVLNALLNEVEAQAGKQLSSEAVALLKVNTQYLIGKIH